MGQLWTPILGQICMPVDHDGIDNYDPVKERQYALSKLLSSIGIRLK